MRSKLAPSKNLQLNRETLMTLASARLMGVLGGMMPVMPTNNQSDGCPPPVTPPGGGGLPPNLTQGTCANSTACTIVASKTA